jgi:hypothetical protein
MVANRVRPVLNMEKTLYLLGADKSTEQNRISFIFW